MAASVEYAARGFESAKQSGQHEHSDEWWSARIKHGGWVGGKEQPMHYVWRSMLSRCNNPNDSSFKNYGARGIAVCERWSGSFSAFLDDMGERPSPKHSIDRIDVDGPYSPENCRWVTSAEQQRNKRNNRWFEKDGVVDTMCGWATRLGISKELAHWRLKAWGSFVRGETWRELPKQP